MSKIYDNAFKVGALFALTVFVSINYRRFWEAEAEFQEGLKSEIQFSGYSGLRPWGWPFNWDDKFGVVVGYGFILNILTLAVLMFVCGFIFRAVWLKISSRS